jgi:hypothetical protein
MPDKEEARLLAVLTECHRVSREAWLALAQPMRSVINGSAAHQKLIEADRAACEQHETARTALRVYRSSKPKAVGT